jgi:two-component system, NarL family, response regulator DegU
MREIARDGRGGAKMVLEESSAARGPSRIIIADDHPLFRSAIRQTLERQHDLEVVAEAANGCQALELSRRLRPELVLMDLRMPEMDGIAATQTIKREFPETRVLILTAVDESRGLSNALEAGAAGYILKDASPAQITDAVRRVLAGESALNDEVAMRLLMRLLEREGAEGEDEEVRAADSSTCERPLEKGTQPGLVRSLTQREVEVLRLVVQGQTNQRIARNLSISVSTVKRHIRHISAKLGACDRVQAAVRAIELGLLDDQDGG